MSNGIAAAQASPGPQQPLPGGGDHGLESILISREQLGSFVSELLLRQSQRDAEASKADSVRAKRTLECDMGIDEQLVIPMKSLLDNLAEAGLHVSQEIVAEAVHWHNAQAALRGATQSLVQELRLPVTSRVGDIGLEAANRDVSAFLRSSLPESIQHAIQNPRTIGHNGAILLLENKRTLDQSPFHNTEHYKATKNYWSELWQSHGCRLEERAIIFRIPWNGRESLELLSPKTEELVARPEPTSFFERLQYLILGPTTVITHPEKRGQWPTTSPALLELRRAIEDCGATPVLAYMLGDDTPGYATVRLSVTLPDAQKR